MTGYYAKSLSGERLRRCYEIASPEVRAYLGGEIHRLLALPGARGSVLELGCGYGRMLAALAGSARWLVGIDNAMGSVAMAHAGGWPVATMDAATLGFASGAFDLVACMQNGISAFAVDRERLVAEAVRATRPGGTALFSSYSAAFWPFRLRWFEDQAAAGLLGPLDRDATRPGRIVCQDGFVSESVSPEGFEALAARHGRHRITDDGLSVFCEIFPA